MLSFNNADIENLKFLHTLFDKHLDHMLAKFEPNRMVQMYKILSFLTKTGILKPFLIKR